MNQETISIILQILTIGGIIFAIYKFFHEPDVKADKAIDLLKSQLESERRLSDETIKTMQNCLGGLTTEVKEQREKIENLTNAFTKLETIINERIPKKE